MSSKEFISKYEQFFSNRLHNNLPKSSEGTIISNIDFLICNYKTKKFIMIELKTKGNTMQPRQKSLYNMLHKRLKHWNNLDDRTFVWTYCIEFSWETFADSIVYIEGTDIKRKTVDEETLKSTLYYLIN